jgi:threonine dehydrogenase-like Zn-dependent dehydrogenase
MKKAPSAAEDVAFRQAGQLRMGQANVKRWIPHIMPFLTDDDPLSVDEFAIHRLPLADAAAPYSMFQRKVDRAVKIMLKPVGMIRW